MKTTCISPRRWLFLPIETVARELAAKTLLACVAAERGWGTIIGEKKTVRGKQERLPRGTYIEKSIHPGRYKDIERANQTGNRVSAWCEEGLIYFSRSDYTQWRIEPQSYAAIDYFFAWGKKQADDIASTMGFREKIVLSGNPRFDLLRPELRGIVNASAEEIRRKYGRFILVNTKFGLVNHNAGLTEDEYISILRKTGRIKNRENEINIRRYIDLNRKIFDYFLKLLPLLSKNFPEHTIILRPHPSESHDPWNEIARDLPNVKVVFEGSVNEWLMAAEVMIHNNCTTGVEAFLLDRPSITYRPVKDELVEHPLPNRVSYESETEDGLMDQVRSIISRKDNWHDEERGLKIEYARNYIANIDGKLASEMIMDTMDNLDLPLAEGRFPIDRDLLSVSRTLFLKMKKGIKQIYKPSYRNARQYYRQKFPGIALKKMELLLEQLRKASGRFEHVQIAAVDDNTYCIYCP